MRRTRLLPVCFIGLALALAAGQEIKEVLGVPVYPGAKPEETTTRFLNENMRVNGRAFRTADPVAKVAEFYKARGLTEILIAEDVAMFKKGDDVDVTLQDPWKNAQTGKIENDTLISIVKRD